ncbi:TonB family protein [Xanthobacter sp. AM11]|uniref:TonB family protein n=1 Tax=Xanthobacter sp. AM11 TaxID=3380643 RepID=UPI0039BF18E8
MSAVHPHHHHWHDFDRSHLGATVLRFVAAGLFIVLVHAVAVYAALFWRKVEAGEAAPPAAVMVELAPMAVSEESQVDEAAPGPQMSYAPETVPDAPDLPEDAAPPPEPVVEQVVEKLPEIDPTPVEAEVVLPKPEPEKQEVKEPPKKKVERPKKDAKPTRKRQAPATMAAPRSDAPVERATAAPSPGAAAVTSAAIADWRSRVYSHLVRFKRPLRDRVGRVVLFVGLSGSGSVNSVRVTSSSGDSALDAEAMAMVHRASPFPAPPDGRPKNVTPLPVNFTTRGG